MELCLEEELANIKSQINVTNKPETAHAQPCLSWHSSHFVRKAEAAIKSWRCAASQEEVLKAIKHWINAASKGVFS
jgi:hypothetical protein